ncbi:MAG: hypothetical protein PVI40_07250 [Chlamydiota bacterium]|jgi:hypothetical protein
MKKYATFLLAFMAVVFGAKAQENSSKVYTDFYTTFGFFSDKFKEYIPSISIGKRSVSENGSGIDFGATGAYLERKSGDDDFVIMFPKVEYIHYGTKEFDNINGYIGLGASTAMYRLQEGQFKGIVGTMTAGVDFFRDKTLNGFIQAKGYYPILSFFARDGKDFPLMQLDVGLGF